MGCSNPVKAVGNAVEAVGEAVGSAVKAVGKAVENVIKNPLPVIQTVALTAVLGPGGFGLSAASAATISSSAVTALNGGDIGDIAKAAASTYIGGQAGNAAAGFAAKQGVSSAVANIIGDATRQSVSTLIQTGGDIEAALKSGAVAGGTGAIMEAGRSAISSFTQPTGQPTGVTYQGGREVPTSPYGTTEAVSATSPYGTTGTVSQPSFNYPSSSLGFFDTETGKALARQGENIASDVISKRLATSLFGQPSAPSPATSVTTTGQGASPGTAALAQALRVDPGATFGGGDQGQQRRVWNTASLRVKDETGG